MNTDKRCPGCGEGEMKNWSELEDEEREVVKRLPVSGEYKPEERQTMHRWCTLCWYESTGTDERFA